MRGNGPDAFGPLSYVVGVRTATQLPEGVLLRPTQLLNADPELIDGHRRIVGYRDTSALGLGSKIRIPHPLGERVARDQLGQIMCHYLPFEIRCSTWTFRAMGT